MNNELTPITIIHSSGILLKILLQSQSKEMNFRELQSESNLDNMCFHMSIGYLFNEGSIIFFEVEDDLRIRLLKTSEELTKNKSQCQF
ncbi:MAG: hypothetical protein V2A54_16515 [Bacteroidota bacterium]